MSGQPRKRLFREAPAPASDRWSHAPDAQSSASSRSSSSDGDDSPDFEDLVGAHPRRQTMTGGPPTDTDLDAPLSTKAVLVSHRRPIYKTSSMRDALVALSMLEAECVPAGGIPVEDGPEASESHLSESSEANKAVMVFARGCFIVVMLTVVVIMILSIVFFAQKQPIVVELIFNAGKYTSSSTYGYGHLFLEVPLIARFKNPNPIVVSVRNMHIQLMYTRNLTCARAALNIQELTPVDHISESVLCKRFCHQFQFLYPVNTMGTRLKMLADTQAQDLQAQANTRDLQANTRDLQPMPVPLAPPPTLPSELPCDLTTPNDWATYFGNPFTEAMTCHVCGGKVTEAKIYAMYDFCMMTRELTNMMRDDCQVTGGVMYFTFQVVALGTYVFGLSATEQIADSKIVVHVPCDVRNFSSGGFESQCPQIRA
eukprot:Selendium_serpulae@DN6221_c0_g1_i13.p1